MGRRGWYQQRYQTTGGGGHPIPGSLVVLASKYRDLTLNPYNEQSLLPASYIVYKENSQGEKSILPATYGIYKENSQGEKSILPATYGIYKENSQGEKSILPGAYSATGTKVEGLEISVLPANYTRG